jgi:hypothetical protein
MEKVGQNDPCPCGSGKKHKRCCQQLVENIQRVTGSKGTLFPLQAFAEGNNIETEFATAYYSKNTIDLLTWKTEELILLKNLTEMVKATDLCISNKYYNSALKLKYSAIDKLAYLRTNRQSTSKVEYLDWINSFMLPSAHLPCTAEEFYSERCGLLHQNTAVTHNLSSGRKILFYTANDDQPEKGLDHIKEPGRDECKFISINSLRTALYDGIHKFLRTASQDPNLKENILSQAQKYFANIEISSPDDYS